MSRGEANCCAYRLRQPELLTDHTLDLHRHWVKP